MWNMIALMNKGRERIFARRDIVDSFNFINTGKQELGLWVR